ncbi:MAG TPA: hypothetical protein VI911_12120 [Patescibacteria group bacterium]|nr:hypothetical protein [Patescibacteria group bacterium]
MGKREIYKLINNGETFQEWDMSDWQCSGALGYQPINESCGGCVGCLLAQAIYAGIEFEVEYEDNERIVYKSTEDLNEG